MWSILWLQCAAASADPRRSTEARGDDEALVAAFKDGEARAFDALFARYSRQVFGYVYRSIGDPALAEDLTQEIFVKAFLHLRRTAAETVFKAWIYRIATTTCIDARRAAARRPIPAHDTAALSLVADWHADDPERRQIQGEQRRAVRRSLDALPAHYRQALILRQLQELSYAEIGEVLGISVEAVTSLIHRARQAFRAVYTRQAEEGGR